MDSIKLEADKISITEDKLGDALQRIIDEKGVEFFRINIYDIKDNRKAHNILKNLPFVKSIGQGCTKKLKELYKKEYIDKQ